MLDRNRFRVYNLHRLLNHLFYLTQYFKLSFLQSVTSPDWVERISASNGLVWAVITFLQYGL